MYISLSNVPWENQLQHRLLKVSSTSTLYHKDACVRRQCIPPKALSFLTLETFSAFIVLFLYISAALGQTYSLNVQIDSTILPTLKDSGYFLCLAKKVNNNYTVVWSGLNDYLELNTFQWQESYQVLGSLPFAVCCCLRRYSINSNLYQFRVAFLSTHTPPQ